MSQPLPGLLTCFRLHAQAILRASRCMHYQSQLAEPVCQPRISMKCLKKQCAWLLSEYLNMEARQMRSKC